MEFQDFKVKLLEKLKLMQIEIKEEQVQKFYNYMNLLIMWNQKMNLTAIIEPEEIIIKHFIDSLTIEKELEPNSNLIDIGTGAGFPGIPLKIMRPDLSITLVDCLQKRIRFLEEVIQKLNLKNIKPIHSRVEEIGRDNKYRQRFTYVTSRAVANLTVLAEYMLPLTAIGGKCIFMKGSNIEEELEQSKKAIQIFGGNLEKVKTFFLADTDIKRNLIIVNKQSSTPKKYPRKPGIPSKQPIN